MSNLTLADVAEILDVPRYAALVRAAAEVISVVRTMPCRHASRVDDCVTCAILANFESISKGENVAYINEEGQLVRQSSSPTDDPWVHRAANMRCATCMWFAEKFATAPTDATKRIGRCRRHAPTMNGYPAVFSTDWCGDHKLNENKT